MSDAPIPPPPPPAPAATAADPGEDKTPAILAYITLVGFIIAIVMHNGKKTKLGAYHLRQVLGLFLTGVVVWIPLFIVCFILAFIPILGAILGVLLWMTFGIGMLVLAIMGLISAINGQLKPVPLVGPLYQKWFANAFN